MIIKTTKPFETVEKSILEHHSYDIPEIIAIEPKAITNKYLKWINEI